MTATLLNTTCDCKDYSQHTARTGIALLTLASSDLTGYYNTMKLITAGAKGTLVRSIIIKATVTVTTGMVRLFVQNADGSKSSLYKEVPISTTPALPATPVPYPMLATYEIKLDGGLKLQTNESLYAATQNAQAFNIVAEGLDWSYTDAQPTDCCNFEQETANTGLGIISTANPNLDGSGAIVTIFNPGANGSYIKDVTIKSLQNTQEGFVRLFIIKPSISGFDYFLIQEVYIPETTPTAYEPSFKQVVELDFYLQNGDQLGAATHNAESFAITVEGMDWSYP